MEFCLLEIQLCVPPPGPGKLLSGHWGSREAAGFARRTAVQTQHSPRSFQELRRRGDTATETIRDNKTKQRRKLETTEVVRGQVQSRRGYWGYRQTTSMKMKMKMSWADKY